EKREPPGGGSSVFTGKTFETRRNTKATKEKRVRQCAFSPFERLRDPLCLGSFPLIVEEPKRSS
ncbi:MAG: hypothetical protein AB1846_08175, partial [Chloroflexota bacterium]